jgi:transposase
MSNYQPNQFTVDIRTLSPELQILVRAELRERVNRADHLLSYKEAAKFYGLTYEMVKTYVHQGRIGTVRAGHGRAANRIPHREMRQFLLTYKPRLRACELPALR